MPVSRKAQSTDNLSKFTREARECNLDYGTYRAMIERCGKTFEELKASAEQRLMPCHSNVTIHYR